MASSSSSKLENLPKEDLVKYIKRQQSVLKQTRQKCETLQLELNDKQKEVDSLEKEKTTWLSRGVHAEFEKKDQISAKEQELQIAAELGKQMLERNDDLQEQLESLQQNHSTLFQELKEVKLERDKLKTAVESFKAGQEGSNASRFVRSELSTEESCRLFEKIKELQIDREETLEKLEAIKTERNQLILSCKDLKERMHLLESDVERMSSGKKYPAEEKIRQLMKEKMELSSKVEMLEEDRAEVIKEFESLQRIMTKLEAENKDYEVTVKTLQNQKEQSDERLKELEDEFNVSQKQTEELRERLDNFNADQADIQSSYSNMQKESSETNNRNEELKTQIEELLTSNSNWENRLNVINEEKNHAKEELKELTTKYEEVKSRCEEMNQRNKELSAQLQTVNQQTAQIKNSNNNLRKKIEEEETLKKHASQEMEKLKVEKEKCSKACRSLKANLEESKKALEQTTSNCEAQKTTILNLQQEKKKMVQVIKKLRDTGKISEDKPLQATENNATMEELQSVISERDALLSTLKDVQKENERVQESYKSLVKQHECVVFEKDEAQLLLKGLQEDQEETMRDKNKLEYELKELQTNKADLENAMKEVNDIMRQERKKMEDIFDNMKEELKSNMQINEVLKKQLSEMTCAKEDLDKCFGTLNEELNNSQQKNKELEKQLTFIKGEKNKIQHAYGAVQKQWQEHQGTCEGSQEELQEKIQKLVSEKVEIERMLNDSTSKLQTAEEQKQKLLEKVNEIEKEKEEIKTKLQNELTSLESEYEEYKNDMENSSQNLSAELSKVVDEKNNLDSEIEEIFHAHDELQMRFDEELKANKELNELVIRVSEEKDRIFKENTVLTERLSEIQSSQLSTESHYYTQILGLQETNQSLCREIDDLRGKLNTEMGGISEFQDTFARSGEEVNNVLKNSGDRTQDEHKEVLEKTIAGLSCAKDEAHVKLKEMEKDYKSQLCFVTDELNQEKTKKNELNEKIKQLETDIKRFETFCRAKDEELERLKESEEIKLLQNRSDQLEKTVKEVSDRSTYLCGEMNLWKEKYVEKECEKEKLEHSLISLLDSLSEIEIGQLSGENDCDVSPADKLKLYVVKREDEINRLTLNIKQRDDKINNLQETSKSLLEKLKVQEEELHGKEELWGKQEQDVLNFKTQLESLSVKLGEKSEECQDLVNKLEGEQLALKDLTTKYKSLEMLLEERDASLEKEQFASLQQAIEKAHRKVEEKEKFSVELQETLLNEKKVVMQLKDEISSLRNAAQVKEHDLAKQEDALSSELKEISERLRSEEDKSSQLQEQLELRDNEVTSLNMAIQTKEKVLNDYLISSKEQAELLDILKGKCRGFEETVQMRNEEIDVLKQKIIEHEKDILQKEQELNKLQEVKEKVEMECIAMKERESYIREEVIKKEQDLKVSASNEDCYAKKVQSYEEILQGKESTLEKLKEENKRHVCEKLDLQKEVNRLLEHLNTRETDTKSYNETIERHSKDMEEIQASKDDLQNKNKELNSKLNKLKQVALKAKKETENAKKEFELEKNSLMAKIQEKEELVAANAEQDELKEHQTEIQKLKEHIARLEESLGGLTKRLEVAQEELREAHSEREIIEKHLESREKEKNDEREKYNEIFQENQSHLRSIEEYKAIILSFEEKQLLTQKENQGKENELKEVSEKLQDVEEQLVNQQSNMEEREIELDNMKEKLEVAEKEARKSRLVDLELKDCQKVLESLQQKLTENENHLERKNEEVDELKKQSEEKDKEIVSLEEKVGQAEEREKKLKGMVVKNKKELSQTKKQENEAQNAQTKMKEELELMTREMENTKVQLSVFHAEKQTLEQQLLSVIESNKDNLEILDAKLNRVKGECEAAKRSRDEVKQEYENYKTRVHSVLKQQKSKPSTPTAEIDADERSRLQQSLIQLKIKLQETSEKLTTLQSDHDDLEVENERLTTEHHQASLDAERKEKFWKDKIEQISLEYTNSLEQHRETIQLLTLKNETVTSTYKEKIRKQEEDYKGMIDRLRQEINDLEKERQKQMPKEKQRSRDSPPLKLNIVQDSARLRTEERQAGEGMDHTELEKADVLSTATTPTSANSLKAVSLERLLSPTEESLISNESDSVDVEVSKARREIEHLSELLRESEATSMRLGEQAKVLKDEIRRLERNQEREQGLSNLEYLKNIILKFLSTGSNEKEQLIPVLTAMLKLSEQEKDFLLKFAKETDESAEESNSSWSSYLYRWSSLN